MDAWEGVLRNLEHSLPRYSTRIHVEPVCFEYRTVQDTQKSLGSLQGDPFYDTKTSITRHSRVVDLLFDVRSHTFNGMELQATQAEEP